MKKILVLCFSILGIITSIDIALFEFFNIGNSQSQNYILLYLLIYLFENELKDFPRDILSDKFVKYPMYLSITLSLLSYFSII
ncbi:hypothetical protein OAJ42_01260 [Flavobacteriales bacterium]|nr:hypothetical protein [Flavobacteriales bacterium]